MHKFKLLAATAMLASAGFTSAMAADTINIADVVEMSGGGASNGVNWTNGLKMAAEEINAKGGILGSKIAIQTYDTQTDATTSRAMVQKSLDSDPDVIMGPIYSGSVKVNMMVAAQAGVPQFVGAQAVEITHMNNPYIFRANIGQDVGMAKIAKFMAGKGVKKLALVWVNNDFGKGGRNVLVKELAKNGIEVAADQPIEYGQADYAAGVSKIKTSGADAVFPYMTAEDTARFVKEVKKQALGLPLYGETTLLQQNVLDLAADALDGAKSHLSLSADAPVDAVKAFRDKYKAEFNLVPDHNAMSAYMALYAVKAITEKNGKIDRQALADALHGGTVTTKMEPNILMDSAWDQNGDLTRESFIGEAEGGKIKIVDTIR